jgi:hypothetical protein
MSKVMLIGPDTDAPNECAVTCDSFSAAQTRHPMMVDDATTQRSSRPTKVMSPATSASLC